MNHEDLDPESLGSFNLPEGLLSQIFECTGYSDGDSGFILAYVSTNGQPAVVTKTCSQIVEMGLRKALEQYLEQMSSSESPIDLEGGAGDIEDNP